REQPPVAEHPGGHGDPQHRAQAGQGRSADSFRRLLGTTDGQGGRVCPSPPSFRRGAQDPGRVPSHRRAAGKPRARDQPHRKGGQEPLAGHSPYGEGIGDEPGGPSPRRRRREVRTGQSPSGLALGSENQRPHHPQEQADRQVHHQRAPARRSQSIGIAMARSVKKGPFVDRHLIKKVEEMLRTNQKKVVKTWSRRSTILPEFGGHPSAVQKGRKSIPVFVTENMVAHKPGEFSPTRTSPGHWAEKKVAKPAAPPAK